LGGQVGSRAEAHLVRGLAMEGRMRHPGVVLLDMPGQRPGAGSQHMLAEAMVMGATGVRSEGARECLRTQLGQSRRRFSGHYGVFNVMVLPASICCQCLAEKPCPIMSSCLSGNDLEKARLDDLGERGGILPEELDLPGRTVKLDRAGRGRDPALRRD
jgi:hypothetical protein